MFLCVGAMSAVGARLVVNFAKVGIFVIYIYVYIGR